MPLEENMGALKFKPQSHYSRTIPAGILLGSFGIGGWIIHTFFISLNTLVYWCTSFILLAWSTQPIATITTLIAALLVSIGVLKATIFALKELMRVHRLQQALMICKVKKNTHDHVMPKRASIPVEIINDGTPRALTIGFIHPRIILSTSLIRMLSKNEREAIVAHEKHHAQRRDPLRRFLWELANQLLFFLPIVRDCSRSCVRNQEFLADYTTIQKNAHLRTHLQTSVRKLLSYDMRMPLTTGCTFVGNSKHLAWLFGNQKGGISYSFSARNIFLSLALITFIFISNSELLNTESAQATPASKQMFCEVTEQTEPAPQETMTPAGFIRINYSPLLGPPHSTQ